MSKTRLTTRKKAARTPENLPIVVNTYHGIGDTINQRPFILAMANSGKQIYVRTPLPELFCDMPSLRFIRSDTGLRTQKKNEQNSLVAFYQPPSHCELIQPRYGNDELREKSIMQAFADCFGMADAPEMDMPSWPLRLQLPPGKRIAIIRPTTERDEWCNKSRGPLNEYVDQCSRILAGMGYHCISIADTCRQPGQMEWIPDVEPYAHEKYHYGQLSITEVMALTERADIVVTGVSFMLHAALAYKTPVICLLGGHGGNNCPAVVADPAFIDTSRARFIYPDIYCMCQSMDHACNKTITGLEEKFTRAVDGLVL